MTISCPTGLKDYKVSKTEATVAMFFKEWCAVNWSFYNFCSWRRVSENNYNKIKEEWQSSLQAIKVMNGIPESIRRFAGQLLQDSKGPGKRPRPSNTNRENPLAGSSAPSITISNSTITNLALRDINTNTAHNDPTRNTDDGEDRISVQEENPEVETSTFLVNPALRSLYPSVYELCKDKAVDIDSITPKYVGSSLHDIIYKFCRTELKRYQHMSKIDRSFLHVALSGIVNTMKPYSNILLNRIPQKYVDEVQSVARGYIDIKQDKVAAKITELKRILSESNMKELHRSVVQQKATLLASGDDEDISDEYKVLEIMEIFIKEAKHGQWRKPKSECDYLFYWKKILEVIFRGVQNVSLSTGELTSNATKFDRFVNEAEFGDSTKYISGRKIDLIVEVSTVDLLSEEKVVELSSLEIKRAGVDNTYITIQQNKNVRTIKSLLGNLMSITSNCDIVTGIDIVGLSGYLFSVVPFCGAAFASIVEEKAIFLPAVENDIKDLLFSKNFVLPLLFAFKDHIDKQAQAVDSACREALQNRPLQAEFNVSPDYILSPTLYSPKR